MAVQKTCEEITRNQWIVHDGGCDNTAIKYVNAVLLLLSSVWIVYLVFRLCKHHKDMNVLQYSIMIGFITTLLFRILYLIDPYVSYFPDSIYYLWELIPVVAITASMILILQSWVELSILAKYPGQSVDKHSSLWRWLFTVLLLCYLLFSFVFLIFTIAKRKDRGPLFSVQFIIDLIFCIGCGVGFLLLGSLLLGRIKKTSRDLFQQSKCRIISLTALSFIACLVRAFFSAMNLFFEQEQIQHLQIRSLYSNDPYWAIFVFFYLLLGELLPVVVLSFVLRLSISEQQMIDAGSIMQMLTDQRQGYSNIEGSQIRSIDNSLRTRVFPQPKSSESGGGGPLTSLDFVPQRYKSLSDEEDDEDSD